MDYIKNTLEIVSKIKDLAHRENKSTGFCIGNTVKIDSNDIYFMPIRHTAVMVTGGAVVYSEQQAVDIAQAIDGKVKCVLVDAEKKISKSYKFNSYMEGIDFVGEIAKLAERSNHHPDINISWCSVDITITSHEMGGVTTKCVNLAMGIDLICET